MNNMTTTEDLAYNNMTTTEDLAYHRDCIKNLLPIFAQAVRALYPRANEPGACYAVTPELCKEVADWYLSKVEIQS